jgi:hypothetical protein
MGIGYHPDHHPRRENDPNRKVDRHIGLADIGMSVGYDIHRATEGRLDQSRWEWQVEHQGPRYKALMHHLAMGNVKGYQSTPWIDLRNGTTD